MEIMSADLQKARKILIVSQSQSSPMSLMLSPRTEARNGNERGREPFLWLCLTSFQVGGSLSGLLAGVLLKTIPQLESITILERSEPDRLQDQGAGIRLGTEVIETLRMYTSFPVEKYSEPLELNRVLNDEGGDIFNAETHDFSTSWGRLFLGLRHTFEELSSGGMKGVYRTHCTVTAVEEDQSGLKVVFNSGNNATESLVADLVIGADGASSTLRRIVEAEPQRLYAGYVGLRGMVPLSLLSERTQSTFHRTAVFSFPRNGAQVVLYPVPGSEQDLESETCINWVWYQPKTEMELEDLMTDSHGLRHSYTLPTGSMREENIEIIKRQAEHELAPQIAEIVRKTIKPFAQAVTDNIAGQNCFLGGKMLLIGDAVAGQR